VVATAGARFPCTLGDGGGVPGLLLQVRDAEPPASLPSLTSSPPVLSR
jgi:hypothetical protein